MLTWVFYMSLSLADAAPIEEMGVKLIALRAEVEEMGRELQDAQKESSVRVDSFLLRKSELEAQLRKERLRSLQLTEKVKMLRADNIKAKPDNAADFKLLSEWVNRLEASIHDSLPFRRTERLANVKVLRERIEQRKESSVSLASEIWTFTERELKLTTDNEFQIGPIELDGQVRDAEIARLGMIQMMFKTSKGQLGYAVREDSGWKLVSANSSEVSAAIERNLKKFKERNSSGWIEVPGLTHLINGSR